MKNISTLRNDGGRLPSIERHFDFVVVGAGPAGMAAAVQAARCGMKVALVNDRGCLGGNMSKEMQTTPIGAHYVDKNFIYRRESGLVEELILENLRVNPQNSVEMWDLTMQTVIHREPNIDLYRHLSIDEVAMREGKIASVRGYSMESEQHVAFFAPFFADCTGNGTVAYLAGAPYMRGCESREDFGEELAPVEGARRENGCTIRLRAKDAGREVVFRQPDWVKHRFDAEDLEHRGLELTFMKSLTGFWWLEWGGMLDTVTDMREISTELTHIVYAVWDYMKNRSGLKDQLREYDLDWVSTMPGRRENRRFLGDYVLTQRDIDEQRKFHDGVAYGGFGYDDHAEEGIFHKAYANTHIYHLGPFEVPLRCLYSKAVDNLFLAGRNISVSHMALCGTRNMWTCLQFGEAVGAAAAVCAKWRLTPRKAALPKNVERVYELLHAADHTLFGAAYRCADDLAQHARIEASSTLESPVVERNDGSIRADFDCCALFPVTTAHLDALEIRVNAAEETEIRYQLMQGRPKLSTTPGEGLKEGAVRVPRGDGQWVRIPCDVEIARRGWHFLRIRANPLIGVCYGNGAPVGLKAMYRHVPRNVENAKCVQITKNRDWDYLLDIWNEPSYCLRIYPPQRVYAPENVAGEWARPTFLPNLWISAPTDFSRPEHLTFEWGKISALDRLQLIFDTSIDNSLAVFQGDTNCQWGGYPAASVPAAVKDYRVLVRETPQGPWIQVLNIAGNYQRLRNHSLKGLRACALRLEILSTNGLDRAQVYGVRILTPARCTSSVPSAMAGP